MGDKINTAQNGNFHSKDFAHAYYDESNHNAALTRHHHTQNEIIFVKEGQCTFDISGEAYTIKKNQIVLISALENHSTHSMHTPYHRYVFVSSMDLCSDYIHDPIMASAFVRSNHHLCVIDLPPEIADEMEGYFKTLVSETAKHEVKWKERCATTLFNILILLYRSNPETFAIQKNPDDLNVIFAIKDYIDHNYSQPLSLETVAQSFYINKYYLSHQFKEIIGYGFKKYIQLIRINKAKILLQNTSLTVNEICTKIGYDNINYFIRLFKEKEEMTPYQYHKMFYQHHSRK